MRKQILNIVLGAITVVSTCSVAKAEYYRTSEYSPIGVAACDVIPSTFKEKQSCYQSIRGAYFDPSLRGYCSDNVPWFNVQECVNATKNKSFDPVEVSMCRNEPAFNRASCAKRFGRKVSDYSYNPRPSQDELFDALDQLFIDLIRDAFGSSAANSSEVCRVENSTGRFMGEVSRAEFSTVAQRYARDSRSCVVTNIKNVDSSRDLISPNGRFVRTDMTQAETKREKDRNRYDRCRILTCVSEARQVRRPRVETRRYGRYDNNYGGYNQMPTPTWGTR